MNTRKNQIFFTLITVIFFFLNACQKEISLERNQNPNIPALISDSNYLSTKYFIDKVGSTIDTTTTKYYYDNLKRVSKTLETSKNNGVIAAKDSIIFFYNATDTIPVKKFEYYEAFGNGARRDTILSFFTYNNLNRLIKDSTMIFEKEIVFYNYSIKKSICNYSYSSNKIYGFKTFTLLYQLVNSQFDYLQNDTVTIDANKNIIESRQTSLIGTLPTIPESRLYTFTYDNKPSPYLNQNINYIFPNIPEGTNLYFLNQLGSKNNRLKVREDVFTTTGGYNIYEDLTGKYTYNSLGFPIEIFIPEPSIPNDYTKLIFSYTSL